MFFINLAIVFQMGHNLGFRTMKLGRDSISLLVANCGVFLWFNLTLDIKRSVCFCFNFSSHDYIWCSNANLLMKSNKWGVFNDRLKLLRHYGKSIRVMFNNFRAICRIHLDYIWNYWIYFIKRLRKWDNNENRDIIYHKILHHIS